MDQWLILSFQEVNQEILNPIFFYIRSTFYDYKRLSTSTTLPSMTQSTLQNLTIGIPPIELQNKFADFVKHIDKLKFCEKNTTFFNNLCYNILKNIYFTEKRGENG